MTVWRLVGIVTAICLPIIAVPPGEEAPLRKESMPEWKLLHKVQPAYPVEALQHRIQGIVRFTAVIGRDGRIESLRLMSGHPLLVSPAREAAQQWLYRPTLLRGKPVRVITEIDVHFRLDSNGNPVREDWRPQPKPEKPAPRNRRAGGVGVLRTRLAEDLPIAFEAATRSVRIWDRTVRFLDAGIQRHCRPKVQDLLRI